MNKRDGLSTKDIFFGRNGKAPRRNVDLGSSSLRVPDSAAGKKRAFSEDSEGEAEYIDTQREIIRDNTPASAIFEPDPLLATHRRAKRAKFGVSQATTMSSRPSAAAGPSASRHNDLIIDESLEETPDPENQPLYMSKAHEMKAGLGHLPFLPNAGHRKRMPEHDPENHEIMRLRVEERMGWADIADALNEDRVGQGKHPSMTEAAVYGRFVRNAPRIASAMGLKLNPKEYMHLKDQKKRNADDEAAPAKWEPRQDEMLIEAVADVQASVWENVSQLLEEKSGVWFSPEECAKRFQQI